MTGCYLGGSARRIHGSLAGVHPRRWSVRLTVPGGPDGDDRLMNYDDLGWKFWAGFVGLTLAAGVGAVICFVLFGKAWESWGFLGAIIAVGAVFLGIAWVHDRRHPDPPPELI